MNRSSPSLTTTVDADQLGAAETRLRGRWLVVARAGWITVAVLTVILVVAGTPLEFQFYQATCAVCNGPDSQYTPLQARELKALGLSPGFYAGYLLVFELLFVVVWLAVALVIFRGSTMW
ncbi:MAG TPA: hypothetical protein VKR83_15925 [Ktedonobacteraceae bacterium]|nr:hypothetical protein [Ktedonobacteraceae bacterium]